MARIASLWYAAGMGTNFKAVILHGFTDQEALAAMQAIKALGPPAAQAAFAMTTPTSVEWKVEYLLEHLEEEHEAAARRRAASPS